MPGNYQKHLDQYGICTCGRRTGVTMLSLEHKDDMSGRWSTEQVHACTNCLGLV